MNKIIMSIACVLQSYIVCQDTYVIHNPENVRANLLFENRGESVAHLSVEPGQHICASMGNFDKIKINNIDSTQWVPTNPFMGKHITIKSMGGTTLFADQRQLLAPVKAYYCDKKPVIVIKNSSVQTTRPTSVLIIIETDDGNVTQVEIDHTKNSDPARDDYACVVLPSPTIKKMTIQSKDHPSIKTEMDGDHIIENYAEKDLVKLAKTYIKASNEWHDNNWFGILFGGNGFDVQAEYRSKQAEKPTIQRMDNTVDSICNCQVMQCP